MSVDFVVHTYVIVVYKITKENTWSCIYDHMFKKLIFSTLHPFEGHITYKSIIYIEEALDINQRTIFLNVFDIIDLHY